VEHPSTRLDRGGYYRLLDISSPFPPSLIQIRPEKLAYLKVKAKEYFLDPRNSERLDQVWVYIIPKYK